MFQDVEWNFGGHESTWCSCSILSEVGVSSLSSDIGKAHVLEWLSNDSLRSCGMKPGLSELNHESEPDTMESAIIRYKVIDPMGARV